jgi:ATP-dependent DNA helicase 2 subunit 1
MDFDETSVSSNKSDDGQEGNSGDLDDLLFLDQNIVTQQIFPTKECIIFLIDCESSMHAILEEEKTTPLTTILKVIESFLKTKIITNEKDSFGIVLFNTFKSNNDMNLDGVNNYLKISTPEATTIKKIKDIIRNCDPATNKEKYKRELNKIFLPNKDKKNYINNALWIAHTLLKDYDKKIYKRRVFLFTDNDDPLKNNTQEKNVVLQRAKDMNDSDIILEIFPMSFRNKFNLANFYALIIPTNGGYEEVNSGNESILNIEQCFDRLKELTKRIRQKEIKKRTLSKAIFRITENTRIYMNIYANIKKANKGRMLYVDSKTNDIVKSLTVTKSKETGADLYPEQIGTYLLYGNKKIKFSRDEIKKIKVIEQPGLTLMGFKSLDSIRPYYNLRESYFIYPNEIISKGSGKIIDALIKQMANKKKCAIVKFVGREGSYVKFCALFPQLERYDEDYFQTPPGLNMIFLPYADDIRSNSDILSKNPKELPKISDKQSELARTIIKKMNINFDCRSFENIEIQRFYATLQALALNEPTTERIEDTIQPHKEGLIKILLGLDEKYRQSIFDQYQKEDNNKKGVKNKKKKKLSISSSDDSDSSDSDSLSDSDDSDSDSLSDSDSSDDSDKKKKKGKGKGKGNARGPRGRGAGNKGAKANANKGNENNQKPKRVVNRKKKEEISSSSSSDSESDKDKEKPKLCTDEKLIKLVRDKILEKMSIEDLKGLCSGKGISTKGMKRQDMLDKLQSN